MAMTCFWFRILTKIDIVNKLFQREDMTIDRSTKHIDSLIKTLDSGRSAISTDVIEDAKKIADSVGAEAKFKETRMKKRKRFYDELCEDESDTISEEGKFKLVIVEIVDRILAELRTRFHAILHLSEIFDFLSGNNFQNLTKEDLQLQAAKLADIYNNDIDKDELLLEVESFKFHALNLDPKMKICSSTELCRMIYRSGLHDAYPNLTTCLRIFLTLPVSVASNERSFSKNLCKEQRLTNLSIIYIEHEIARKLSYEDIIQTFAAKKARKVKL